MYQFLSMQFIPFVAASTMETVTISCRHCYRVFDWLLPRVARNFPVSRGVKESPGFTCVSDYLRLCFVLY